MCCEHARGPRTEHRSAPGNAFEPGLRPFGGCQCGFAAQEELDACHKPIFDRPEMGIAHVNRCAARGRDAVLMYDGNNAMVDRNQLLDIDVKLAEWLAPEAQEVEDAVDAVEGSAAGKVGVDQLYVAVQMVRDALSVGRCEGLIYRAHYVNGICVHRSVR